MPLLVLQNSIYSCQALHFWTSFLVLFSTGMLVLSTLITFTPQAGDKVVYSKYAGTEVAVAGSDYVLLKVLHC